jgi:hypothetical protein
MPDILVPCPPGSGQSEPAGLDLALAWPNVCEHITDERLLTPAPQSTLTCTTSGLFAQADYCRRTT